MPTSAGRAVGNEGVRLCGSRETSVELEVMFARVVVVRQMAQSALRRALLKACLEVRGQEKKWSPNASRGAPHLHGGDDVG